MPERDWGAVLIGLADDLESDDEDRLRATDVAELRGAAAEIYRLRAMERHMLRAQELGYLTFTARYVDGVLESGISIPAVSERDKALAALKQALPVVKRGFARSRTLAEAEEGERAVLDIRTALGGDPG